MCSALPGPKLDLQGLNGKGWKTGRGMNERGRKRSKRDEKIGCEGHIKGEGRGQGDRMRRN